MLEIQVEFHTVKLEGILPAVTTPFAEGEVSGRDLRRNLARYERQDLGGYLVLGSTGEAVLLEEDERRVILEHARAASGADKQLIVGVAAESTRGAVRQARIAADCGASAVLVSTPHYFRSQMTEDALVRHIETVANGSPLPVLLYNVPKFTGLAIPRRAVRRASRHSNVVGIKESSGDLDYLCAIVDDVPPEFVVLCGDAGIFSAALSMGASGAILAAATVFPEPFIRMTRDGACMADRVRAEFAEATALIAGRFGVAGLKAAMDLRGLYGGPVRSPLESLSPEARREVERALERMIELQVIPGREL